MRLTALTVYCLRGHDGHISHFIGRSHLWSPSETIR